MNIPLSTTERKNVIWEENDSIELPRKSENKPVSEETDSIACTESGSVKNECKGTGKISGIYKIINNVNGKYYLGGSSNIKTRWNNHKKTLRRKSHDNKHLERAWHKYGEDSFRFDVVEGVIPEQLMAVEQKYLDICKKFPKTNYNISYDASAPMRGKTHSTEAKHKMRIARANRVYSEETKRKISISHMGKLNPFYKIGPRKAIVAGAIKRQISLVQIDNMGNVLEKFPSIKTASQKFNIPSGAVSRVCRGEYKQTHGLFFRFGT